MVVRLGQAFDRIFSMTSSSPRQSSGNHDQMVQGYNLEASNNVEDFTAKDHGCIKEAVLSTVMNASFAEGAIEEITEHRSIFQVSSKSNQEIGVIF